MVKQFARAFGAEIVTRGTAHYWERQSLIPVLHQIPRHDVTINTVLDVGAAHGDWSRQCAEVLPDAHYALFEPLEEYRPYLEGARAALRSAEIFSLAIQHEAGTRTINVHPDLVGSSLYRENEDSDVNGVERTVAVDSLDAVCARTSFAPPFLLKADVQGAEMDVLRGAKETLSDCAFVILETSLFDFYGHGSTVNDTIRIMTDAGFALYDIFGLSHRPLDGALAQVDLCFVAADGPFRQQHFFATSEQRRQLTARLRHHDAPAG